MKTGKQLFFSESNLAKVVKDCLFIYVDKMKRKNGRREVERGIQEIISNHSCSHCTKFCTVQCVTVRKK